MIEFLTANWLWILLGIGALWFFTRGHGMGGHSHGAESSRGEQDAPHAGHAADTSAPARRHGCC